MKKLKTSFKVLLSHVQLKLGNMVPATQVSPITKLLLFHGCMPSWCQPMH